MAQALIVYSAPRLKSRPIVLRNRMGVTFMFLNCGTVDDVLKSIKDKDVRMVDLRFTDLPGTWQHFSVPPGAVDATMLSEGIGFDGSSIRGFQEIQESDMLVVPDPATAIPRPVRRGTTLVLICNIRDPVTGQSYSRDARYIAQKAETYLKTTGVADTAYFGPEAEFFVFDEVRYGQGMNYAFHEINSREGTWNTGEEEVPNLGHKPRQKEGYFPVPPVDSMQDLRTEMVLTLEALGIKVEAHHHEVATAGQAEIDMRFTTLTRMADNLMLYKYVVKNVARKHDMTATFMPKPLFEDNASGMHVHQSLWKGGTNLFHSETQYAGLSELGRYYIGGLLRHAWALCGFALRLPTPIAGSCRATRRRSIWSIRSVTAPPAVGSRCIRRTRAPSVSSSERRIPPAMDTWHSRQC